MHRVAPQRKNSSSLQDVTLVQEQKQALNQLGISTKHSPALSKRHQKGHRIESPATLVNGGLQALNVPFNFQSHSGIQPVPERHKNSDRSGTILHLIDHLAAGNKC